MPDSKKLQDFVPLRRRLLRVDHDERGNAIAVWEEIPPDDTQGFGADTLTIATEPGATPAPRKADRKRTDLRKLSEWMEARRRAEAAKKNNS